MNSRSIIAVLSVAAVLAAARLGFAQLIYTSTATSVSGADAIVGGRITSIERKKYSRELPDSHDFRTDKMVHQKQWFDEATLEFTERLKGNPQYKTLAVDANGDTVRTLHLIVDAGIERSDGQWGYMSEVERTGVGAEGLWFLHPGEFEGTYRWGMARYESEREIRECLKTLASNYAGWESGFATDDKVTVVTASDNSPGGVETVVYPDGSVAILGRYQKDLELGGKRWFSSPSYDYFLAKLAPSGEVAWCRQIGCGTNAWLRLSRGMGESLLLFVTGPSTSCTIFGAPVEYKNAQVVVAVSPEGRVQWTCSLRGRCDNVWIIPEKNHYRMWGTVSDTLSCGNLRIHAERGDDWFTGTLDANGRPQMLKSIVLPGVQQANLFAVCHDSSVLLAGTTPPRKTASSLDLDAVVCMLSSDGHIQWADTIGGHWMDQPWSIAVAPNNDVLATIDITDDAVSSFVAGSSQETRLIAGARRLHLFAWNAKGKRLWKSLGGGDQMAIADDGEIYCAGSYGLPGLTEVPDVVPRPRGDRDLYMMCYDPTGFLRWAARDGGLAQDLLTGLTLVHGNRAVLVGFADAKTFIAGRVVDVHGWDGAFLINLPLSAPEGALMH